MKKNTVKDLYGVIAKLTITELMLLKSFINLLEKHDLYDMVEDRYNTPLLYSDDALIHDIDLISNMELSDYKILKNLESLCKKGILTKDDDVGEIHELLKDAYYLKINWDAEIEEAILPDGYTGRIY